MLIVIDMQNDFITGVFGTAEARKIVPKIRDFIKTYTDKIIFTKDTHFGLNESIEEKTLPKHCILGTEGWQTENSIYEVSKDKPLTFRLEKTSFGSLDLAEYIKDNDDIYICGLCTDICVISNALMLRSMNPRARIVVISDLCAGTTPENHQKALDIMQNNLIEIKKVEEL